MVHCNICGTGEGKNNIDGQLSRVCDVCLQKFIKAKEREEIESGESRTKKARERKK